VKDAHSSSDHLPIAELCSLRQVGRQFRQQHSYIEPSDECWVIADYHVSTGSARGINRLIFNWKCAPSSALLNPKSRRSKERAILVVASILRRCCDRTWTENATWCPIPTSRIIGSADYDDRLGRTVRTAFEDHDLDLRMLLRQTASTPADHIAARRLTCAQLYELLQIDFHVLREKPLRQRIILFDDMLTSGKHFKCCQRRLREVVPEVPVCGLFFARRVQFSRWCGTPLD